MEKVIGADGVKRVMMTRAEYAAAQKAGGFLPSRQPLRPAPPAAQTPGEAINRVRQQEYKGGALGELFGLPEAGIADKAVTGIAAGITGAPPVQGEGIISPHTLGNLARSLGIYTGATLATGNPFTGIIAGSAIDRPTTYALNTLSQGEAPSAGAVARKAVEGAAIGGASAITGAGVLAGAGRAIPAAATSRFIPAAAEATGQAIGFEGAEAAVDRRAPSALNVAADLGFFGLLEGVRGLSGLSPQITPSELDAAANASSLAQALASDLPAPDAPRPNLAGALDPSLIQPAPPPDINTILPNATPATPGQTLRELAPGEQSFARRQGRGVDTPERPSVRARVRERVQATPEPEAPGLPDIENSSLEDIAAYLKREDEVAARREQELINKHLPPEQAKKYFSLGERGRERFVERLDDETYEKISPAFEADSMEAARAYQEAADLRDKLTDIREMDTESLLYDATQFLRRVDFKRPLDRRILTEYGSKARSLGHDPAKFFDKAISEYEAIFANHSGDAAAGKEMGDSLRERIAKAPPIGHAEAPPQPEQGSLAPPKPKALPEPAAQTTVREDPYDIAFYTDVLERAYNALPESRKKSGERIISEINKEIGDSKNPLDATDALESAGIKMRTLWEIDPDSIPPELAQKREEILSELNREFTTQDSGAELPPLSDFSDPKAATIDAVRKLANNDTATRVRLADLREELGHLPREDVDAALKDLQTEEGVVLGRIDDGQDLAQRDLDARMFLSEDAPRDMVYLGKKGAQPLPSEAPATIANEPVVDAPEVAPVAASAASEGKTPRVTPAIRKARLALRSAQSALEYRVSRDMETSYFEDLVATRETELDGLLEKKYPGLAPEARSEFIETGKLDASKRVAPEEDIANLDADDPTDDIMRTIKDALADERGASIRPIKAIQEHRQQQKRTRDFIARQSEMHKRFSKARPEERAKIVEDMQNDVRKFAQESQLNPDEIVARAKALEEASAIRPLGVETSALKGKNRKQLVAEAKALGLKAKGTNESLMRDIAFEQTRRNTRKGASPTPEEAAANIATLTDSYIASKKKRKARGTLESNIRAAERALIDIRKPAKDYLKKYGDAGQYVTDSLEQAAHRDSYSDILIREAHERVYGDVSYSDKRSERDWFGGAGVFESGAKLSEKEMLDRMIMYRSSLELAKRKPEMKFTDGMDERHFTDWVEAARATPEGQKLYDASERFFKETRAVPERLLNEGLITEEQFDGLIENQHYAPRWVLAENQNAGVFDYLLSMDPDVPTRPGSNKVSVSDSGLERLSEGSLKTIEENTPLLLDHVILSTERRIAKNQAAKDLIDLMGGDKDAKAAGFFLLRDGEKVPRGSDVIAAMIDGKKTELVVPNWFADSWKLADPLVHGKFQTALRWASGASLLRESATGALNPIFAARNLPKDLRHLWITQDAYSAFAPKAVLQMGKDLAAVTPSAWQGIRRDRLSPLMREYLENGGGGATLSDYTARERRFSGQVQAVMEALSSINQLSETAVRLAHYKRLKDSGISPRRAAAIARDRINFSHGGQATKFANNMAPYLNAKAQGLRSIVRAVRDNPARTSFVLTQDAVMSAAKAAAIYAAAAPVGELALGRIYDLISDQEKAHNDVFPLPLYRTDPETGEKHYAYLSIAKDESAKLSSYYGEQIGRYFAGKDPNLEPIEDLWLDQFVFSNLSQITPPTFQAGLAYWLNYDLFRNDTISKLGDVGKARPGPDDLSLEDEHAREAFKDVGKATGLSPDRTQRAVGKVLNEGNPIWGIAGTLYDIIKAASDGDPSTEAKLNDEALRALESSLSARILRYTKSDAELNRLQRESNVRENRSSVIENRRIEEFAKKWAETDDPAAMRDEMRGWLSELSPERQQRAKTRLMNSSKLAELAPEIASTAKRVFRGNNADVQAVAFFDEYVRSDEKQRKTLLKAAALADAGRQFGYFLKKVVDANQQMWADAKSGKVFPDGVDRTKLMAEIASEEPAE